MAPSPQPFQLSIPETALVDLKARLAMIRFPDQASDAPGPMAPTWSTCAAFSYWKDGFDRRAQEAALNAYPQFKIKLHDDRRALPARAGKRAIIHATVADASSIRDGMGPGSRKDLHSVNKVIMGKALPHRTHLSGRLFERGAS